LAVYSPGYYKLIASEPPRNQTLLDGIRNQQFEAGSVGGFAERGGIDLAGSWPPGGRPGW